MYPEFAAQARQDRDSGATAEFAEQSSESKEHAGLFRTAAKNFGLLTPIEQHHAETYGVALEALQGKGTAGQADQPIPGKWILIPASPQAPLSRRFPTIGTARSAAPAKPALFLTAKPN